MSAKKTYEDAMLRLEEIVEKLNEGSVSLDESIKLYEESTKLALFCNDCLEKAKLKVSELSEA